MFDPLYALSDSQILRRMRVLERQLLGLETSISGAVLKPYKLYRYQQHYRLTLFMYADIITEAALRKLIWIH